MYALFFQVLNKTESQPSDAMMPPSQFDSANYYFEIVFFLLIVLGVAFLCIKYLFPRLGPFKKFGKDKVKVVARIPLDGRKSVYVLELDGSKEVLIGTSDTQVNFLCELDRTGEKDHESKDDT